MIIIALFLMLNLICIFINRNALGYLFLWFPVVFILASVLVLTSYVILAPPPDYRGPEYGMGNLFLYVCSIVCLPLLVIHLFRFPLAVDTEKIVLGLVGCIAMGLLIANTVYYRLM